MALGVGAAIVARQFVKFDDAIFAASAKFSDLNITTKEGQATMERLRKTARKVGEETKFNAVEAAQGLDFLALAGFNTEQAMAALPGVVSLATVANIDLATATDIATDSLGAFNLMSDNSAEVQKNLTRVNDVFAKTTATSNTNLTDLFESVKKGAPTFTAAGQSIESFSALVGTMANSGVKGSEAGTQLRNMMLRLVKSSPQAQKEISRLGVNIKDSEGNFLDVIDIIGQFETGLKGMGTAQRSQALSTIFGSRAVTGMNILLAEGSGKLRSYRDELINAGGSAQEMAAVIEQSMGNKIKALGSAATEAGFKIFEAFSGDGKTGIDVLTQSIREFDPTPIIHAFKGIGLLIKGIGFLLSPIIELFAKAGRDIGTIVNFFTLPKIEKAIIKRPDLLKTAGNRIERREGFIGPGRFASPESQNINRNTTTTTTGNINMNVTAPKSTTVEQSGTMPENFVLNMGTE
jgi:TP901 family phage tail tape measure protein